MCEDNFLPNGFRAFLSPQIGEEASSALYSALKENAETGVRLNRLKPLPEALYPDMEPVEWCSSGFYLKERPKFTLNPLLHAGAFYVQDPSSMVYERIAASLAGGRPVMAADLCAAPGGKTTAIINALPPGSGLLANEFSPSRAAILKENLVKWGFPDVVLTNSDVSKLSRMESYFDIVAVDAPCSGEGMMRKEEAARSQWTEGLVRQCASLQRSILENAAAMLAPGGFLIYSTCTFNTMEDEDNAAYIADELGLEPVDTGLAGPGGIRPQAKGAIPCLRFMPGFARGEGLFVAVFRKPEGAPGASNPRKSLKQTHKAGKRPKKADFGSDIIEKASSRIGSGAEIRRHEERLLALTPPAAAILDALPKGVRVVSAGVEIGEVKGKDLVPAHALALNALFARNFPEVALTEEDALRYLSRQAIVLPTETARGYVTLTFRGLPLGFAKNLGNRCNSLYPAEWRIRTL